MFFLPVSSGKKEALCLYLSASAGEKEALCLYLSASTGENGNRLPERTCS
jgi:hypothetical protein